MTVHFPSLKKKIKELKKRKVSAWTYFWTLFFSWFLGFLTIIFAALWFHAAFIMPDILSSRSGNTESDSEIVMRVGALIELPDETPTVATVTDPAKLAGEPFFAQAMLEDKVLIYTTSRRIILYRPSTNEIINIGDLSGEETLQNN